MLLHNIRQFSDRAFNEDVWVLGVRHCPPQPGGLLTSTYWRHLRTLVRLTYREAFEPIPGTDLTTDKGWGCMLRSGQMMLAQAMQRRYGGDARKAIRATHDSPAPEHAFSLHNLVRRGETAYGVAAGGWYGPTNAARVIRDAMCTSSEFNGSIATVVCQDGIVCVDEIDEQACCDDTGWQRGVLILVPLQLGVSIYVSSAYVPAVVQSFRIRQSVGIIGGAKDGHSVYFVGASDTHLHLLDPHSVHVTPSTCDDGAFSSAHQVTQALTLRAEHADPSLAFGFYCKDRDDFCDLTEHLNQLAATDGTACRFPISVAAHRHDHAYSPPPRAAAEDESEDDMYEML